MNCPLCNIACERRLDLIQHLVLPVKYDGHGRLLAEAQTLVPAQIEERHVPLTVSPESGFIETDEIDDQCPRPIATKIGDRVAVLMGRTEWPDGHKIYHWCSGYATEIYPTQTVTALDKPCDGRSHVRRESRFVRVIG